MIQKESNVGASDLTGEIWLRSFSGGKKSYMQEEIVIPKTFAGWKFHHHLQQKNVCLPLLVQNSHWSESMSGRDQLGVVVCSCPQQPHRKSFPPKLRSLPPLRRAEINLHMSGVLLEKKGKEDPWKPAFNTHAGTGPYVGKIKSSNIMKYHKNRFAFVLGILAALPNPSQGWWR